MKEVYRLLKRNRSSIWKRGFAYLVDILLLNFVVVMPFSRVLRPLQGEKFEIVKLSKFDLNIFLALLTIALLSYIYFVYLEYKLQKTIGKILLRIKVNTKGKLDLKKVLIRNITKPFLIILILEALYMLYKGENQRYSEMISDTWVEDG